MVGAFAEQVVVPASSLQPVDPAVGLATAAASGVAHATAYHALRSVARVQPGEWVVVLGAAGGVGLAAVELGAELEHAWWLPRPRPRSWRCAWGGVPPPRSTTARRTSRRASRRSPATAPMWSSTRSVARARSRRSARCAGAGGSSRWASHPGRSPAFRSISCCSRACGRRLHHGGFRADQAEDRSRDQAELAALARAGRAAPYISAIYPLEGCGEGPVRPGRAAGDRQGDGGPDPVTGAFWSRASPC